MSVLDRWPRLRRGRRREEFLQRSAAVSVLLPSAHERAEFRARITFTWRLPAGTPLTTEALREAHDLFMTYAPEASRRFSVLDKEEAESRLNLGLSQVIGRCPLLIGGHVQLTVPEDVIEHIRERRRRELEVELERSRLEAEVARLRLLRDTVLRDAATARLWWLDSDPRRLVELAAQGDRFEQAVALVAERDGLGSPEKIEAVVARLLQIFLTDLGPEARRWLIQQLATVFTGYERPDLAGELLVAVGDQARDGRDGTAFDESRANGTLATGHP